MCACLTLLGRPAEGGALDGLQLGAVLQFVGAAHDELPTELPAPVPSRRRSVALYGDGVDPPVVPAVTEVRACV